MVELKVVTVEILVKSEEAGGFGLPGGFYTATAFAVLEIEGGWRVRSYPQAAQGETAETAEQHVRTNMIEWLREKDKKLAELV